MPHIHSRIIGGTGLFGSSAWWWISYHQRPSKPIKPVQSDVSQQDNVCDDEPFSGKSIDSTIRRGGW
jgi:hypothetical protein